MLMSWCQHKEPEEQAGDAEVGDQRSPCISGDSHIYTSGFMKQPGKSPFRNTGKGKLKDWSFPSFCY